MDELERLVDAYRARTSASVKSKLDLLMNVERIRDARVVPFLLAVLGNPDESEHVRVYVLKQLRNGDGLVLAANRVRVTYAVADVLRHGSSAELRLQAALALGEFTHVSGVLTYLNEVCVAREESLDLRYAAFTSLERAGPTPECVALLRQMTTDETLGHSARSVLATWHVD